MLSHGQIKFAVTLASALLVLLVVASCLILSSSAAPRSQTSSACPRELQHANRTLAKWAETMEQMVSESSLPASIRDTIHSEANNILDMIEEFGQQVGSSSAASSSSSSSSLITPSSLARDLVTIRRRSNRMALDIYLNTFDMRWPQNSLQLGIIVERVQQACLDRATIQALESPASPLEPLVS